jgi:hypothetical protein
MQWIRGGEEEGRMSGYMVMADNGNGYRNFYMVAMDDPARAVAEVNRDMKTGSAVALAPVSDETLAHFATTPASIWLCFTSEIKTGKITASQLGEKGRQFS